MFNQPRKIDVTATINVPSGHWREHVDGNPKTVEFLPLVDERKGPHEAGWCTYANHLEGAPDVEVLCGGKNDKLPTSAAIWRQGNLLHFGFHQTPSQMNDTGRDLLENCIVYAAKFVDDRPLGHFKSGFVDNTAPELRRYLPYYLDDDRRGAAELARRFFSGELAKRIAAMADGEAKQWVRGNRDYLVPKADGNLEISEDLRTLGVGVQSPEFLPRAAAALQEDGDAREAACGALQRHVPDGPRGASAAEWSRFVADNRDYLFYSEDGGYVWLLDTLAQARKTPSAELRGSARSSR